MTFDEANEESLEAVREYCTQIENNCRHFVPEQALVLWRFGGMRFFVIEEASDDNER